MNTIYASLKGICFLMLMMCWGVGFGQQPTLAWAKGLLGSGNSYSQCVVTDALGNVYTTGYFESTVDFDPGPGVYNLSATTPANMFISKLDSSGNFIWAEQFGSSSSGYSGGNKISIDASNNILINGSADNFTDLDPGPGTFFLSGGYNFILKLDPSGNFIWAKNFTSNGFGGSTYNGSSYLDSLGNIYTTGSFDGTIDFDPGPGTFYYTTSSSFQDIFISKLDSLGNFIWAQKIGSSTGDYGTSGYNIRKDHSGNIYVQGSFKGTIDFDPGPSTFNLTSTANQNIFISKFDSLGNFIWAKSIKSTSENKAYSFEMDAADNIYFSGYFSGTVDFDPGIGVYTLSSASQDVFVSKLDSIGNLVWAKKLEGPRSNVCYSLCIDAAANIYMTGFFYGTVDFDPGSGIYNLSAPLGQNGDMFILKLDSSSNFIWASQTGDAGVQFGRSIFNDLSGNLYLTGAFKGLVDFDPGVGIYYAGTPSSNVNIFVLKMRQSTTLPLHLLTFTAKRANNTNLLNWTTAQEVNTDRFEIERSPNGREFSKIGTVKANSINGQYNYTDNNPFASPLSNPVGEGSGVRYYRLKMLDKDSQFTYSPVRQLTINHSTFNIAIYPNPAHNKLQLQINSDQKTTLQLDIITQDGKVVLSSNMSATEGSMLRSINVAALQGGTYFLRATSGSGEQSVVKFEKL